jgi:predicted ribosomally synthesized peptide with nif11-like leader
MSLEEVKRLEADAKTKEAVREKLKDAGAEPSKLAAVASSMGYSVSEADINQYIAGKKSAMSQQDLDQVSGGSAVEQTTYEVSTTTTTTETATETDVAACGPVVAT